MTLDRRRFLVAAAGAMGLAVTGCSRPAPVALVYRGPASTPGAPEAVAALLAAGEHAMDVRFVGPAEADKLTAAVLSTAVLYVQPGGADNLDAAWEAVAPIASALRSWIHDGGAYLGCCMGGFLAGRDPGFDLLPGDAVEYSTTPGATVNDIADTLITVTWRGQPQAVYFQGGPGFMVNAGPDDTLSSRATPMALLQQGFSASGGVRWVSPDRTRKPRWRGTPMPTLRYRHRSRIRRLPIW